MFVLSVYLLYINICMYWYINTSTYIYVCMYILIEIQRSIDGSQNGNWRRWKEIYSSIYMLWLYMDIFIFTDVFYVIIQWWLNFFLFVSHRRRSVEGRTMNRGGTPAQTMSRKKVFVLLKQFLVLKDPGTVWWKHCSSFYSLCPSCNQLLVPHRRTL